jgi:hypothetical protein
MTAAVSAVQTRPSAEEHLDDSLKMTELRTLLSVHDSAVRSDALAGHALQHSTSVGERVAVLEQNWKDTKDTLDTIKKLATRSAGWIAFGAGSMGVWALIQIFQWAVSAAGR